MGGGQQGQQQFAAQPMRDASLDYNVDPAFSTQPYSEAPKVRGEKKVYDEQELRSMLDALRRVGIFDMALPPEVMRQQYRKSYALPDPSGLYGTEEISF